MTTRLITAYYIHETEREAAEKRIPGGIVTQAFVHGEIEEDQISALREQGLFIDVHDDLENAAEPAGDDLEPGAALESTPVEVTSPAFYVIRLHRPLLPDNHRELAGLGVELLERVCPVRQTWEDPALRLPERREFKARLTAEQVKTVQELAFVRSVRLYAADETPVLKRPPEPTPVERAERGAGDAATADAPESAARTYDIVLHRPADEHPEDRDAVLAWLDARAVPVVDTGRRKIRVELDPSMEGELRSLHEVAFLDEYVEPHLLNDEARRSLGVEPAPGGPGIPQTGSGQVIGIADTGIDETHPDFTGRIREAIARARPNDPSDPHGHGTHVAGSIVGTGAASNGEIRGIAPDAEIVFQSIRDSNRRLKFPTDLGDLFQEAYDRDARIHNNSWGANTGSQYRSTSFDVDDFVWRRRDMLVVIAAGNEGTAVTSAVPPRVSKGFPDWLSIGAPATSKNALVVGASRSTRTAGGYAADTWSTRWPHRFEPPDGISGETISGNAECLAGFSSRGPCMDDRIKPDVVAPGTDILSARAATAGSDTPLDEVFWGVDPLRPGYAYMGGTSMAAPLAAGCAALVRQYYVDERGHEKPSAALLKATLVNGARWLTGKDAVEGHALAPNFHQGFGVVYLPTSIPNPGNPRLRLEFFDPWEDRAEWFVQAGLAREWEIPVNAGTPLRVCLAFTDLPASGLQNRLHLFVAQKKGPGHWAGNQNLPYNPKAVPDPYNNVQIVRIDAPVAGWYRIKVAATGILQPQDFALVVTGDLASSLT